MSHSFPTRRSSDLQPPDLLRKILLPRLGLHDRRDRTAAVQLQRAAGRVSRVRRAGRTARIRPRSRRPQPCAQPEKGRGGAVGEIEPALALLYAGARKPRQSLGFRPPDKPKERRVGNECVSKCRSRWLPFTSKHTIRIVESN